MANSNVISLISGVLVDIRPKGLSPAQASEQILSVLEENGLYLARAGLSGQLVPNNKMSIKHDTAQRVFDPEAPYAPKGAPARGCEAQQKRAKQGVNLAELEASEASVPVPDDFSAIPDLHATLACECTIAENGCIDPSLCLAEHSLAAIPAITRWNFHSAERIAGGCQQVGWSGWAHPAVMKILGRFPSNRGIQHVMARTHKSIQHLNERVKCHLVKTCADGTPVYHFEYLIGPRRNEPGAVKISQALATLPLDARIGGSLPEKEGPTAEVPLPTSFVATPPVQALGGLSIVPTFLPVLREAPGFSRTWEHDTWPTQMIQAGTRFTITNDQLNIRSQRQSEFVYHYPRELAPPSIGETFRDDLHSLWAYRPRNREWHTREISKPCGYSRYFRAVPPSRIPVPDFEAITNFVSGTIDYDNLSKADKVGGFMRAMGARANRLQQGFEAEIQARWLSTRDFAQSGAATRQHFELCYRVASRYIGAQVVAEMNNRIPDCALVVDNTTTNVQIIHINAATPLPPPGMAPGAAPINNGEFEMWQWPNLTGLANGTMQFLDVEGMPRELVGQLLGALLPLGNANIPYVRRTLNAGQPDEEFSSYALHMLRNTFPNGVTHVFLHHGNNPLPPQVDQNWLIAHAFDPPDASMLSTVVRHIVARHDLGSQMVDAFQTALYRAVGYKAEFVMGTDAARVDNEVIDADGNFTLDLPRNNTRWDYFDAFYEPVALPSFLESFLRHTPSTVVHIGTLLSHARAVSLNWACKTLTMLGLEWSAPRVGGNQFIRGHLDKWERKYYWSTISLWASVHDNAMALQFGFAPPAIARATEAGSVVDWWQNHTAPYLANHYMELWMSDMMPTFQVLPYYDPEANSSCVQWPEDTPRSALSWLTFDNSRFARVAREFKAFPGYAWLGDGGSEYNLQFYVAQGNNNAWRKAGAHQKGELVWWPGDMPDQQPVAAAPVPITNMGPINTPFADFLLPGSVRSNDIATVNIRSWGIRQTAADPLTDRESHRWWEATQQLPHRSLMVNYIHPPCERRQVEDIANYSVVLWEQGNKFAGITFSNLFDEVTRADARFDQVKPQQSMFNLNFDSKPTTFSAQKPSRITAGRPHHDNADLAYRPDVSFSNQQANRNPSPSKQPRIFSKLPPQLRENVAHLSSASGKIEYDSKYPHYEDELPPMEEQAIEIDGPNVSMVPNEALSEAQLRRLAQIDNAAMVMDEQFQEYLAEQKRRVLASPPQNTRPAPVRPTSPRQRSRNPNPRPYTPPKPRVQTQYRAFTGSIPVKKKVEILESRSPVVVNDSAAVEAQAAAKRLAEFVKPAFRPNDTGPRYPSSNYRPAKPSPSPPQSVVSVDEDSENPPLPPPNLGLAPALAQDDNQVSDAFTRQLAEQFRDTSERSLDKSTSEVTGTKN